jgi:hypothetical protein
MRINVTRQSDANELESIEQGIRLARRINTWQAFRQPFEVSAPRSLVSDLDCFEEVVVIIDDYQPAVVQFAIRGIVVAVRAFDMSHVIHEQYSIAQREQTHTEVNFFPKILQLIATTHPRTHRRATTTRHGIPSDFWATPGNVCTDIREFLHRNASLFAPRTSSAGANA